MLICYPNSIYTFSISICLIPMLNQAIFIARVVKKHKYAQSVSKTFIYSVTYCGTYSFQ